MPTVEQATSSNRLQQLLYTLGRAYLQKEQYAEAFDKFKQLLQMDADNAELLLDTAIAALGLNDASAPTLDLYEKAVNRNPDSAALKFGLASLFVHQNIATPFAVELCQNVVELAPPNEQQIRLFLKKYYESAGLLDKAQAEEQKAIFNSRDSGAIRVFLEKLWWDGKFDEALKALQAAPRVNGNVAHVTRELAMAYAYQALAAGKRIENFDTINMILAAAPLLAPAASVVDLRDYLALRLSLLLGGATPLKPKKGEEIFAATPFNLSVEILNVLHKPATPQGGEAPQGGEWRGFLLAQVLRYNGSEVPERLRELLSTHLAELPNTILRLSGTVMFSLSADPALQIRAMVDFMQSLEDYNAAVPEAERVMLAGGLQVTPQACKEEEWETLAALVEATHLLRFAEQCVTPESGVGTLLLRSEDAEFAKPNGGAGYTLMPMEGVKLLPGRETTCSEVVWRNPLSQLKPGQVYVMGRFEVRKRLLKHNSYGTFLAHDLQLDRPMIMKVMLPADAAPFLQNEEKRRALYTRIRAIARLSHPHLAFMFDMGEHEGMMFLGRECVEGHNLTELNFREEQRDGEILAMLQKIVRALIYANSKSVAHLNLKPGNIWLSEAQELKITDFRIPGFIEDGANASVLFPAHWRYLAPEILFGENGEARSDIYSLGIIAYELLAGKHPYNTAGSIQSPRDLAKARIAPLADQERPHHRAWNDFIMKAIQREPERRFADLTVMDQELRAIQMEMLKRALNSGR